MKRKNKLFIGLVGLASVALIATGCTANFSTSEEKSRIAFALESGVSKIVVKEDLAKYTTESTVEPISLGGNVYQIYDVYRDENSNITGYSYSSQLSTIISNAKSSHIAVPAIEYFVKLDQIVFEKAVQEYNVANNTVLDLATIDSATLKNCIADFGYLKFYKDNDTFAGYRAINSELRKSSYTGKEVARKILDKNGLTNVKVEKVTGYLKPVFR